MEHGKELLIQAVSTILFCVAVTLLFHQARTYSELLNEVKETYGQEQVLYESNYQEFYGQEGTSSEAENCSYEELVASLFGVLEYDLEIDSLLISKYEHTIDKIEEYHLQSGSYSKSYCFDQNGVVTRIVYRSI